MMIHGMMITGMMITTGMMTIIMVVGDGTREAGTKVHRGRKPTVA